MTNVNTRSRRVLARLAALARHGTARALRGVDAALVLLGRLPWPLRLAVQLVLAAVLASGLVCGDWPWVLLRLALALGWLAATERARTLAAGATCGGAS